MTDQYTDAWLDFWTRQATQVQHDYCPACGEITHLVECQHCGYDIARYYDRQEKQEAEALVERS